MCKVHHTCTVFLRKCNLEAVKQHRDLLQQRVSRQAFFAACDAYKDPASEMDSPGLEDGLRKFPCKAKLVAYAESKYLDIVQKIRAEKEKKKKEAEEALEKKKKEEKDFLEKSPVNPLVELVGAAVDAKLAEQKGDVNVGLDDHGVDEKKKEVAEALQKNEKPRQKNGKSPQGAAGQNPKESAVGGKTAKKKGKAKAGVAQHGAGRDLSNKANGGKGNKPTVGNGKGKGPWWTSHQSPVRKGWTHHGKGGASNGKGYGGKSNGKSKSRQQKPRFS